MKQKAWEDKTGVANVAGLAHSSDWWHVQFNNAVKDAFAHCEWDDVKGEQVIISHTTKQTHEVMSSPKTN